MPTFLPEYADTERIAKRLARLADLPERLWQQRLCGIERESLRVDGHGHIATDLHPKALGATLTHPWITTDFAEALVEIVTTPHTKLSNLKGQLGALHWFVLEHIGDQFLWPASMPPQVDDFSSIPIADFGPSDSGQMKSIYRNGLMLRYGKAMQLIAGIHYNFSLPNELLLGLVDEHPQNDAEEQAMVSQAYFDVARAFVEEAWLLCYLFGASPIGMQSSLSAKRPLPLDLNWGQSHGCSKATSLRLSPIGYHNEGQDLIDIRYDNLPHYIESLEHLTTKAYPPFSELGVKAEGQYRQLNDALLQIENEYYSVIRPKQPVESGERPTTALKARGVAYLEVRLFDLNPFESTGLSQEQLDFMDVFMLHQALRAARAPSSEGQWVMNQANLEKVVLYGRDRDCQLKTQKGSVRLLDWAQDTLEQLKHLAQWLDAHYKECHYTDAVNAQLAKLSNPDLLPCAQVQVETEAAGGHMALMSELAKAHRTKFSAPPPEVRLDFERAAQASLEQFARLAPDDIDGYIARYFGSN